MNEQPLNTEAVQQIPVDSGVAGEMGAGEAMGAKIGAELGKGLEAGFGAPTPPVDPAQVLEAAPDPSAVLPVDPVQAPDPNPAPTDEVQAPVAGTEDNYATYSATDVGDIDNYIAVHELDLDNHGKSRNTVNKILVDALSENRLNVAFRVSQSTDLYEMVIESAESIGAKTSFNGTYLKITLPATDFTLPLYTDEGEIQTEKLTAVLPEPDLEQEEFDRNKAIVERGQEKLRNQQKNQVAVQNAISNRNKKSLEFEDKINRRTGAPAGRRALVMGIKNPEDRLATLRNFYPDAQPYGGNGDNFLYTDPETGQLMLFNPPGFDGGDVAEWGREITEGVFTIPGAILGGTAGTVVGAPLVGASAGAGVTGAMGGQTWDNFMRAIYPDEYVDTRSPWDASMDALGDAAFIGVGEGVGRFVEGKVKRLFGGGTSEAEGLLASFKHFETPPTVGQITNKNSAKTMEAAASASVGGTDRMMKVATAAIASVNKAATKVATAIKKQKGLPSDGKMGEVVKTATINANTRFKDGIGVKYDKIFDTMVNAPEKISITNIGKLLKEFDKELANAPETLKANLRPAMRLAQTIINDNKDKAIPFSTLRQIRKDIGADLDNITLGNFSSAQNSRMKRLYGALTKDISDTVSAVNPSMTKKLAALDGEYASYMKKEAKLFEKITKFDADERAWKFTVQSARDNAGALKMMRKHFEPDEWDDIVGNIIGRLGRANPGSQGAKGETFSISTFLSRWNGSVGGLSPDAKDVLFSNKRYSGLRTELDRLFTVVERLKSSEATVNTSNTARTLASFTLFYAVGGGLVGLASGGGTGGIVGSTSVVLGTVLAPRYAAKLLTNEKFIKWLATPVKAPNTIGTKLGALKGLAAQNADIAEAVDAYLDVLSTDFEGTQEKNNDNKK